MDQEHDSPAPRRLIDTAAKTRFLTALRAGGTREAAAAEAGFPLKSLYGARRRDALFGKAWVWALELSAGDEQALRGAAAAAEQMPTSIASQGGRLLQRRRMRWVRFTEGRQRIFLAHFAGTADACAAAEVAGVSYATVYGRRRRDPVFAVRWEEALHMAYPRLEAEAVRQRLEAQRRLSDEIVPTGEVTQEFERMMKLLARWDRRGGGIGPREVSHGRRKSVTFDEAIEALHQRLQNLGVRIGAPPPPQPTPHEDRLD